jgi:flagellar biogenesis protein FliO
MLERIRMWLGAMLLAPLLIVTFVWADQADRSPAAANGAVSLREDAQALESTPDEPAGEAGSTDPVETPPPTSDSNHDGSAPTRRIEQTALGVPNGPLSARPVETDAGAHATLLERLDPRSNETLRVLGALAVVLALLFALRLVMRRAAGRLGSAGRPSGVLEILARYPIARGQSLMVLKMARRIVLVHHSGASMRTLSEISDPEDVASLLARMEAGSRSKDAQRFRSLLTGFERQHEHAVREKRPHEFRPISGGDDHVEIVDLTRRRSAGFANPLGKRRAS